MDVQIGEHSVTHVLSHHKPQWHCRLDSRFASGKPLHDSMFKIYRFIVLSHTHCNHERLHTFLFLVLGMFF